MMGQLEKWIYIGFAYFPWICSVIALIGLLMGIIQKMIGEKTKKWLILSLSCTGGIGVWFLVVIGVVVLAGGAK